VRRTAAATYVQITRQELEDWLDDIGFRGKWELKEGTKGIYLLHLGPNVAIKLSSTVTGQDDVRERAKASMQVRLVSTLTGQVLNKKAQGQSHFSRTTGWRKNWRKGIDRMKAAYDSSRSFYDAVAEIEDRDRYKEEMVGLIHKVPNWQADGFLSEMNEKLMRGGILTVRQRDAVMRAKDEGEQTGTRAPSRNTGPSSIPDDDPLLIRMRELYKAARRRRDEWTMDFAKSVGLRYKGGRSLTSNQQRVLDEKFRDYRV